MLRSEKKLSIFLLLYSRDVQIKYLLFDKKKVNKKDGLNPTHTHDTSTSNSKKNQQNKLESK